MANLEPLIARVEVEAGGEVGELERVASTIERIAGAPAVDDKNLDQLGRAATAAAEDVKRLDSTLDGVDSKEAQQAAKSLEVAFDRATKEAIADLGAVGRKLSELNQVQVNGGALRGLGEELRNIGGGLLALEAGRRVLAAVISETEEAEGVLTQLANAAESAGNRTGLGLSQLQEIGARIKSTFVQTEEEIARAEADLLKFQNIGGEAFERVTRASLDLAEGMGKGIPEAAALVGGSLNDPISKLRSLREAGISFTSSQREAIAALVQTGRVAEAQNIILKALEDRFKGASERARQDFAGSMANAEEAVGNLAEAIGEGGLAAALKNLSGDIQEVAVEGQTLNTVAKGIGAALGTTVTAVSTGVKVIVDVLRVGAGGIQFVMGTILESFAALPLGLAEVAAKLGQVDLAKSLRESVQPASDAAKAMIDGAKGVMSQGLEAMGADSQVGWNRMRAIWEGGAAGLSAAVPRAREAANGVADAADGMSERAEAHLAEFRKTWLTALGFVERDTVEKAKAITKGLAEIDAGQINLLPPAQKEKLRQQMQEALDIVRAAGLPITQEMQNVAMALGLLTPQLEGIPKRVLEVGGALSPLGDNLRGLGEAAGPAGETVSRAGGQISTAGGQIIAVGGPAAAASATMAGGLDKMATSAKNAAGPAAEAGGVISRAGGEVIAVGPGVQTAGGQIEDGMGKAAAGMQEASSAGAGAQSAIAGAGAGLQTAATATAGASGTLQKAATEASGAGAAIAGAAAGAAAGAQAAGTSAAAAAASTGAEVVAKLTEVEGRFEALKTKMAGLGQQPILISVDLGPLEGAMLKLDGFKIKAEALAKVLADLSGQIAGLQTGELETSLDRLNEKIGDLMS